MIKSVNVADNRCMLERARQLITRCLLSACIGPILVLGCKTVAESIDDEESAPEEIVPSEEQGEIVALEDELRQTLLELEIQGSESAELRDVVSALQKSVGDLEAEIINIQAQANIAAGVRDAEVQVLKTEREALLRDLERVANAADAAAAQAAQLIAIQVEAAADRDDGDSDPEMSAASKETQAALADALSGLGFRPIEGLGYQRDTRLGDRLAVTGTGLAVDSIGEDPFLFDPNLSFDASLIYLTIADPAGREPRLVLTVQYVSDVRPLYAETAFITIEGNDPIDPIDPVIFIGKPERETDGVQVREAFSREVDRQLLNRLSEMLSSRSFASTFVGTVGQESHLSTMAEREAMSRMLFAYIDLGGYR